MEYASKYRRSVNNQKKDGGAGVGKGGWAANSGHVHDPSSDDGEVGERANGGREGGQEAKWQGSGGRGGMGDFFSHEF